MPLNSRRRYSLGNSRSAPSLHQAPVFTKCKSFRALLAAAVRHSGNNCITEACACSLFAALRLPKLKLARTYQVAMRWCPDLLPNEPATNNPSADIRELCLLAELFNAAAAVPCADAYACLVYCRKEFRQVPGRRAGRMTCAQEQQSN